MAIENYIKYIQLYILFQLEAKRRLGLTITEADAHPTKRTATKKRKQSSTRQPRPGNTDHVPPTRRGRPPKSPRYTTANDELSPAPATSPPQYDDDDDLEEPPSPVDCSDEDDMYRPPASLKTSVRPRHTAGGSGSDQDSKSSSSGGGGGPRASAFSNALIKAGSRSTKDSSLEKGGLVGNRNGAGSLSDAKLAAAAAPPVIQRKTPGLLLQAAGRGLINLQPKERDEFSELLKPKKQTISFGLYGGHLSVDQQMTSSNNSSASISSIISGSIGSNSSASISSIISGGNARLAPDLASTTATPASTSSSLQHKPFMSLIANKVSHITGLTFLKSPPSLRGGE